MTSIDKLARRLGSLEAQVRAVATQPRLGRSSIDGANLELRDLEGNVAGFVGTQFDGTTTSAAVGGTPPASPTMPLVTPVAGGLTLYWDGTFVDGLPARMDFKRVTFHAVTDLELLDPLSPSQIVGEITIATGGEVSCVLPPVEHFVVTVAWSDAGKFSVESDAAFGTPLASVTSADIDGFQDSIDAIEGSVADRPLVYRQAAEPVLEAGEKGIWYDTDDGNVPWFNDGTGWVKVPLGEGAIAADAVIAATIAAGALDGKVITGSLIQTVATADRGLKIVDNAMTLYDDAGVSTLSLDGDTGGVQMVGPLVAGGTLTGSTFQTSATPAQGIKVVGNILTAYDGVGDETVVINGNTGDVSLKADLVAGSSITGALFQTAETGKRLEIASDLSDLSRLRFFSGLAEEANPNSIIAVGSKIDDNNIATALSLDSGTLTGTPGYSSIMIRGGKGSFSGIPANYIKISNANDGTNSASINVSSGPAGLLLIDPPGSGDDSAALTGTLVDLQSYATGGSPPTNRLRLTNSEVQITSPKMTLSGNFEITGKVIYAGDDTAWRLVGAGGQPAFTNSWVNFGGSHVVARFMKIHGLVFMQGLVKSGTMGQPAFTLPVGYRPSATIMGVEIQGANTAGRFDVLADGKVVPTTGDPAFFSLTMVFPADQ